MEKDIKKSAKLTLLVGILMLIVIATSTTYAYFKTRIKSPGSKISVTGSNFSLNITDNALTASGLKPIYDKNKSTQAVKKEFTISIGSDGITSACYDLYIDIESLGSNLRNKYFKYEITNGTDTYAGNFSGRTDGSQILIMRNQNINTTNTSNSYTLYLWLAYGDNDDSQGELLTGDATSRTYKGRILAKAVTGSCKSVTLTEAILEDNPTISERTDFSVTNTENTTGTLYKTNKTEDGSDVYYYSGNTTKNWVKFGGFYWRIIRTNEDGSVRMLYSGTSHDTTSGYIGTSAFNSTYNDPMYVGYMYGTSGSLANNRTNENDSTIKTTIDTWYQNNLLTNYDKYISKTAIYCNDRSVGDGTYNFGGASFYYGSYVRLNNTKKTTPSYKCGANINDGLYESTQATEDKFSASTSGGGNGQLKYPIALMTADEFVFAGGAYYKSLSSPYAWFYTNSANDSITGTKYWRLLSPSKCGSSNSLMLYARGSNTPGYLESGTADVSYAVRPVISLSSCVKVTGNGTPESPYEIDETSCN